MLELKGRDLLCCQEWTKEEIDEVLKLAKDLKHKYKSGKPTLLLKQKTFFMLFYNTSTRTRNSFEAAMTQLGGHAHYVEVRTLRAGDVQAPEDIKDTAKVLEKYGNGIGIRVYTSRYGEGEQIIREYAKWAEIPVVSMESDVYHPCQALADMLTIQEKIPKYEGKKYVQAWAYSPTALRVPAVPQENIMMMTRYGMDVVYVYPKEFKLDSKIVEKAKKNAKEYGGSYIETNNLEEAFEGAHVIYMRNHCTLNRGEIGDEAEIKLMNKYKNWTCTEELMALTDKKSILMHCLPVHRDYEVSSTVLDGPHSVIYDEAENRLHVQKAVLSLIMK